MTRPARALYLTTCAVATLAAVAVLYDFVLFSLPRMSAELADGFPGLFRITPSVALPVAIALALWFRSTAALWLFAVHTLAYRLHYFLGASAFEGQGLTLPGLFRHPVSILVQAVALGFLIRFKELGRP